MQKDEAKQNSRTAVPRRSLIGSLVRSQKAISLSSGESEFLAIIAGACEAIYVADCLRFMVNGRANVTILCRSDSAAGRGICQRLGCGRIRHLHCGVLWVQQAVRTKVLQLSSISGVENPADLGTKPLGGTRVRELLFTMGAVGADTSPYGAEDKEEADRKRETSKALKNLKTLSANHVTQVQALVPLGNRAVSTNLYFREKNFRIFMMRKFRLAEPAHPEGWECKNFSCGQSATGIEGEGTFLS